MKPGYKQTEVGVIPEEWEVLELEAFARVIDSLHQTPQFSDDGYPMVRVTDIKTGDLNLAETFKVSKAVYEEFVRNYKPKRGDIVLSRVGSYGVSSFVETDEPFCMGQNTVVLQPRAPARLLYYVLNSRGIRQQIEDGSYGSGYKSLSLKNIKELRIPLPPTEPEQRAIAEALSDVDALLGGLDRLIAKKRDLKQAAMQQLLTGQIRLPGFQGEWEVKTLQEVCQKIQDGTHFSPKLGGNDHLYVTSKNIRFGTLDMSTAERISAAEHDKIYARCDVRKGDLLLTKDGANTGNAALNPLDEPFSLLSSVALLRFDDRRHAAAYFMYQLLSTQGQEQIKEMMSGNAITRLTLVKIRALRFVVPTVLEQTAIASVLSDMDAELAALEQRRAKTRALKQGMLQELLTGATRLL